MTTAALVGHFPLAPSVPYRAEILDDSGGEGGEDVCERGVRQLRGENRLQESGRRVVERGVSDDEEGDAQERGGLDPRRKGRLHEHTSLEVRAVVGNVFRFVASVRVGRILRRGIVASRFGLCGSGARDVAGAHGSFDCVANGLCERLSERAFQLAQRGRPRAAGER